MAKIKDIASSMKKFQTNAGNAGPAYKAGVQAAAAEQNARAIASVGLWQSAVSSPAAAARFVADLRKAGPEKYATNAASKGADKGHYADGVRLAGDAWQAGFGPFQAVISGLQLPARGLRGSAANLERVAAVANALHEKKAGAAA